MYVKHLASCLTHGETSVKGLEINSGSPDSRLHGITVLFSDVKASSE